MQNFRKKNFCSSWITSKFSIFFRQIIWFLGNKKLRLNLRIWFCITYLVLSIHTHKKIFRKIQFYINHLSHVKVFAGYSTFCQYRRLWIFWLVCNSLFGFLWQCYLQTNLNQWCKFHFHLEYGISRQIRKSTGVRLECLVTLRQCLRTWWCSTYH